MLQVVAMKSFQTISNTFYLKSGTLAKAQYIFCTIMECTAWRQDARYQSAMHALYKETNPDNCFSSSDGLKQRKHLQRNGQLWKSNSYIYRGNGMRKPLNMHYSLEMFSSWHSNDTRESKFQQQAMKRATSEVKVISNVTNSAELPQPWHWMDNTTIRIRIC